MGTCELTDTCPFYNNKMDNMPADAEDLKTKYCRGNNLNCARYMVTTSAGNDKMPANLYPQEKERAFLAIAEA